LLRLTERCKQAVQSGRYCVADCSLSGRRRRQTTTLSATTVGRRRKDGDHDGRRRRQTTTLSWASVGRRQKNGDHDGETRSTSADHALSTVRDVGRRRRRLVIHSDQEPVDV